MNKRCLLVDACNLIHRIHSLAGLMSGGMDLAVEAFLTQLRPLHDDDNGELHLVVDGKGPRMEQHFVDQLRTLSIIYAPGHLSADSIIESWLLRLGKDWEVRVASGDRSIVHSAIANDAEPLSASQLLEWLDRVNNRSRQQINKSHPPRLNSLENKLEGLS